VSGTLNISA
ncbi:hypothetical protein ECEC1736_3069, partial [Escherichia coli EC1736]